MTGIHIAQTIFSLHEGESVCDMEDQKVMVVTDVMYVSDSSFMFSKNYQGFETLLPGEIWGRDNIKNYSFATEKILIMPNTKFQDDLKRQPKTWLVYFGELQ